MVDPEKPYSNNPKKFLNQALNNKKTQAPKRHFYFFLGGASYHIFTRVGQVTSFAGEILCSTRFVHYVLQL